MLIYYCIGGGLACSLQGPGSEACRQGRGAVWWAHVAWLKDSWIWSLLQQMQAMHMSCAAYWQDIDVYAGRELVKSAL